MTTDAWRGWAEWYDVFYAEAHLDEVEFYVDLAAKAGGPVLEMGVGTGRIAIPAAQAGAAVTGVDLHQSMLNEASRKLASAGPLAGSVELIRADMRELDLGRRFALFIIPARTLMLVRSRRDQERILRRAAAHLAPGGRLVFNVSVPDPETLLGSSGKRVLLGHSVNPETGRRCILWAINRYNSRSQLNRGTQTVEEVDCGGRVVRSADLDATARFLFPAEVHVLAQSAGLRVLEVYGGFDGSAFTEASEEMIVVAEAC